MASTICPECGTLLLPGDEGHCPICRRTVLTVADAWDAPEAVDDADLVAGESHDHETPEHERFAPVEEAFFQEVRARLRQPDAARSGRATLIGLVILFAVVARGQQPLLMAAMFLGAMAFHELGHWTALLLLNYRDPKVFFFPILNDWLPSRREWAPQWKRAIVHLAGPLPGIVLGFVVLIFGRRMGLEWGIAGPLGLSLIVLNGFYILPVEPMDGGRFLNIVLFSRQRGIEAFFVVATSLLVLAWAFRQHAIFLGIAAMFGLLLAPARYKIAGAAAAIRRRWDALPARIDRAGEPLLRDLYGEVRYLGIQGGANRAVLYASTMKQVHERALVRPAPILASIGLLAIYLVALLASLLVVWRFLFR